MIDSRDSRTHMASSITDMSFFTNEDFTELHLFYEEEVEGEDASPLIFWSSNEGLSRATVGLWGKLLHVEGKLDRILEILTNEYRNP